jgi:hypothetical protein
MDRPAADAENGCRGDGAKCQDDGERQRSGFSVAVAEERVNIEGE